MKGNRINKIISEAINNWLTDREVSDDFKRDMDWHAKRRKEMNDKIASVKDNFGDENTEIKISSSGLEIILTQKLDDGLYIKNTGLRNTYFIEQFSPFGEGGINKYFTWGDYRRKDGKMPEFRTYNEYLDFFNSHYHSIIGNHNYGWWETDVIDRDKLRRKYPHGCQVFDNCKKALGQWKDE